MKMIFFIVGGLVALAIVWLVACSVKPSLTRPERTLKEDVVVQRTPAGGYSFKLEPGGKWRIYKGSSPDKIDWSKPFSTVDGNALELPAPDGKNRVFFGLESPKGDTMVVAERRIPLAQQPNLRDLGGLTVDGGRQVKWGVFYRSGKLSDLSKSDLAYFSQLGVRTVVDLRNNLEIKKDPDKLPKGVKYVHHSLSDKEGEAFSRLRRMVLREGYRRAKAKALFEDVMRAFADTLARDVQPIFDLLLDDKTQTQTPLLYHCSGGKDRTGYMTAMLLAALGVDRKTIVADYLMSNYYRQQTNVSGMRKAKILGLDDETLEYAFLVREDYMNAVFDVMDKKYGGTDNYLLVKFGLDETKRKELRERYTAPYFKAAAPPPVARDSAAAPAAKE